MNSLFVSSRKSKKAQAGMEYIHTYGWVLLTMMVLGGAMMYYNFSNEKDMVPSECIFLSGINCMDVGIDKESETITFVLVNEFGYDLSEVGIQITGSCAGQFNTSDGNEYNNLNVLLAHKQTKYEKNCSEGLGSLVTGIINMSYVSGETGITHYKIGSFEYDARG